MGDEHAHKFRVIISDLDSGRDAYHAKSVRPGDILSTINNKAVPDNWDEVLKVLNTPPEDKTLHLATDNNKIIII